MSERATPPRPATGPVEGNPAEETKWLCDRGDTQDADALGGIDIADVSGMMLATEDSFRQQLADLRRNLNEVTLVSLRLSNTNDRPRALALQPLCVTRNSQTCDQNLTKSTNWPPPALVP